jgi:hypothetical protein
MKNRVVTIESAARLPPAEAETDVFGDRVELGTSGIGLHCSADLVQPFLGRRGFRRAGLSGKNGRRSRQNSMIVSVVANYGF